MRTGTPWRWVVVAVLLAAGVSLVSLMTADDFAFAGEDDVRLHPSRNP